MIGFELEIAESRARGERKRAIVRASIDMERGGKVDLKPLAHQKVRFAIISPNIDSDPKEREAYPWCVTMFYDLGPWGHTVHRTLDGEPGYAYTTSAVQEVALNVSLEGVE